MLNETLASHNLLNFSIGSAELFQLPRDSSIVTFNSFAWLNDPMIGSIVSGVVLVSAFKGIVSIRDSYSADDFKGALSTFNEEQPDCIRKLLNSSADVVWSPPTRKFPKNIPAHSQAGQLLPVTISLSMHLSPDLQASATKRRKVSLDDCLPCASHEAQRSTPASTLHSSSASTSRKRMSNSEEVDAESGGTASSKRRCHRGIRSAAARECNYMSAHNRHCSISDRSVCARYQ